MTQREIEKFLANTKVYTNGKNKEILKKLFQFGYTPFDIQHEDEYNKAPFMFIWADKSIGHGCDIIKFKHGLKKEITADEILSLELIKPSYRPFKDKDECWQEMLKHQPFGWVIIQAVNEYRSLSTIGKNRDFGLMFDTYTFADGIPFGIKED